MSSLVTADESSITFAVDDVKPGRKRLDCVRMFYAMKLRLRGPINSCSDYHTKVVSKTGFQSLLAAVRYAHKQHYPLTLSPDAVWLTIAQGVAHHVHVSGAGTPGRPIPGHDRPILKYDVPDWIASSPENPWSDAFDAWTEQIRMHVGDKLHSTFVCDFSTTTKVDRAVSQIVLMDVFQQCFRQELSGICGIPEITLTGSCDDWIRLREKVDLLRAFDLDWWLNDLMTICDQFVRARKGDIHLEFWRRFCTVTETCAGDVFDGWVARLIPYLRDPIDGECTQRNPIFVNNEGFTTQYAPSGLSRVPFRWSNLSNGDTRNMEIVAGLTGVVQDRGSCNLTPISGWAIRDAPEE